VLNEAEFGNGESISENVNVNSRQHSSRIGFIEFSVL
jgi:hypothetical protein